MPQNEAVNAIPIIILNWNGLEDTVRCVEHALLQVDVPFRIWVIDNGSDGADYQMLQKKFGNHSLVEVSQNTQNLGFTGGMNLAICQLIERDDCPEAIALLNNDAFVEPTWLAELVAAAQPGVDLIASSMRRYDDSSVLDNAGHIFLNTGEILPRGTHELASSYLEQVYVEGACAGACLIKTQLLKDIGLFDDFFSTGYEDAELGLRAMLAGSKIMYAPRAVVTHKIGASIDKIRDLGYAVRLQVNINYTYLKLMPVSVMIFNSPYIVVKTFALLTLPIIFMRWRLWSVQVLALWKTVKLLPLITVKRREKRLCVLSSREILGRQKSFFRYYLKYFFKYLINGQKTIFER